MGDGMADGPEGGDIRAYPAGHYSTFSWPSDHSTTSGAATPQPAMTMV